MKAPKLKTRKCKVCKCVFQKTSLTQSVCSMACAIAHAEKLRIKREEFEARRVRVEHKKKLVELKPMIYFLNKAEKAVNAWIRWRDREDNCISCGRWHNGEWNAGHYRSVGAAGHLRFNEDNIHKQCVPCNKNLSGNIIEYRPRLIRKIGIERVEGIENNNTPHKWTREELQDIEKHYREKLKKAKASENDNRKVA